MMEPRENDERLADWVDGRMSERDRERLQAEIQVNPELAAKAESYRRTVELVRSALGEPEAPVDIADRVLAAVQAGSQQRSAPAARLRLFPMLASVGAAAALVLVYFSLRGLEPTPESRSVANLDAADAEVPHDGVVRGGEHREAEKLAVGEAAAADDAGEHMAKKGGRGGGGGVRARGLMDQRAAQLEEMADEIQATLDAPDLNYIAEQIKRGQRRVQEDANRQLLRANEPQAPARKDEDKSAGEPETILQAKSRMRVAADPAAPGAEYEGKARGGRDPGRGRRSDQRAARPGAKIAEPPAGPTTGGAAGKTPASGQEKSRTAKSGPAKPGPATPGPARPSTPQGHKGPGDTVPPSPTVAPVQSVELAAGAEARQQGQTERQTGENSKNGQLKTDAVSAAEQDRAGADLERLESSRKQVAAPVLPGVSVVVVAAPPLVLGEAIDDARDLAGTREMDLDGFFAAQFPMARFLAVREQPPQAPDAGGGGSELYFKRLEPQSITATLNAVDPQLLLLDSMPQQLWAGLPGLQPDAGNQVYCVEGERAQVGAMLRKLGAWVEENRTEVRFDQVPQPIVDPFFAQVEELRRASNKEQGAKAEAPTEEQVMIDNEAENAVSQRMKVLVVYEQQPKLPATPPAEQPKPAEAQRAEKKR